MEPKDIRELIELIGESDFASFEMEREGFRLKLKKEGPAVVAAPVAPVVAAAPAGAVPAAAPVAAAPAAAAVPDDGLVDFPSPIVGTFYRAAGPDTPSFVEVGDRVTKGQVLCIVEAMKVMNEIEAEVDAEIVEIAVKNEQPVEFGEVLFRLRPAN